MFYLNVLQHVLLIYSKICWRHIALTSFTFYSVDDYDRLPINLKKRGVVDGCIEWQVNFGYQKFHKFLIKLQKKPETAIFQYHILQNHIHTNPYLEAHKPKINPSNAYMLSIQLLIPQ